MKLGSGRPILGVLAASYLKPCRLQIPKDKSVKQDIFFFKTIQSTLGTNNLLENYLHAL